MSKTALTRLPANTQPDAKFTSHHIHEVVSNLTDARQVASDYSNTNRYTHRATVAVTGLATIRPYDPIYLDGLPNELSGYWTVLSVKHIFGGQPISYQMELEVGTDVLGDTNPNAAANSQIRNVTSSLSNQSATTAGTTLINIPTSVNGTVLNPGPAANSTATSVVNPLPSGFVTAAATAIPAAVMTTPFSLTTPNFSNIKRTVQWTATNTAPLNIGAPSTLAKTPTTPTAIPVISTVTAVDAGSGRAYNNGKATIKVALQSNGNSTPTLYTVTPSPATSPATFTSTTSTITVTGLSSNTSYTFSTVVTNAIGNSAAVVSNAITATTVPQAPTLGAPTSSSESAISIPFTTGNTGGSAITSYTVTSTPTVGSIVVPATTTSPINITGPFTGGTSYTLTVAAVNANGTSATVTSSSVTPTASVPTTVLLSTVTTKGDLIAATGSAAVTRLGVGVAYQQLVPDTTQTTGIRWGDDNNILTIMGAYI